MNTAAPVTPEHLKTLLLQTSDAGKHAAYQVLPRRLAELVGPHEAYIFSRFERERFDYIRSKLDPTAKSVLEIGPNSGFFSFELLDAGASRVTAFEGGAIHCRFLRAAARALGFAERMDVREQYFTFDQQTATSDIALLMNVVHHTGDDYADTASIADAKVTMLEQINAMARYANQLVFQMGFTWKGINGNLFFEGGSKAEMIDYVRQGTTGHWDIEHIGIGQRDGERVYYEDANDANLPRDNALGEFLNRPLFILRRA